MPGDVRVASCDATDLASFTVPSLTSVTQPTDDIARQAVDAALRPGDDVVRWVDVRDFDLAPRESCGCVPRAHTSSEAAAEEAARA